MSDLKYRPGIFEPVLYLLFWFFQTWGWVFLFFFLAWKVVGCDISEASRDGIDTPPECSNVI